MFRTIFYLNLVLLALSGRAFAVTLVEMKDDEGGTQKMWIDGQQMRIQHSSEPGYMLMHLTERRLYMVDPDERQVLDMSEALAAHRGGRQSAELDVAFVKRGEGPMIAGYETSHYEMTVNGQKCSDEYLSRRALSDIAAMDAFDALANMAPDGPMGMAQMDPCDAADFQLTDIYQQHGFPLRVVRADGTLETEVTRVTKNAPVPVGGFSLPAEFRVIGFGQMMREAMPKGGMPEGVDPAQMERMMQEMMKRMEQK